MKLLLGDCLEVMKTLDDDSVDTIITDPPYGLEFMGKDWDRGVPGVAFWSEMLRIAKPGATLLAMGGTRTYHRLVCAIEDAGWEIKDMIEWMYGSGFPKSYNISKGMDKALGAEREVVGWNDNLTGRTRPEGNPVRFTDKADGNITAPATPEAQKWDGWGTALKPAHEPICVAYKPREGTYVNNALKYGVAGLWIDGGRVPTDWETDSTKRGWQGKANYKSPFESGELRGEKVKPNDAGRFPANVIHDGSDEVLRGFPETKTGDLTGQPRTENKIYGSAASTLGTPRYHRGDSGSAARFFYCAKASRSERNAGLEGMEEKSVHPEGGEWGKTTMWNGENGDEEWRKKNPNKPMQNHHPTVKPIALMEYLVRLTKTPTGGVVLDPFMGSGTTGIACVNEGREFIGIEQSEEYLEIARRRITYWQSKLEVELPLLQFIQEA